MKQTVELSLRLQAVASYVTPGNKVADIGCDHGFVPIYLVQKQLVSHVIAMDVNKGPLAIAKEHINEYGLGQYIETRLSDGVSALCKGEVDTMICAGMGGRLVLRILQEGLTQVKYMSEIILQPQSEIQLVRRFLRENGFLLLDEDMVVEDGKYYPILYVTYKKDERTDQSVDKDDSRSGITQAIKDLYGPFLIRKKHPVLERFLNYKEEVNKDVLKQLELAGREDKITEITQKLKEIQQIREEWRSTDEV